MKEGSLKPYAGTYRLVRMVIGGYDCSEAYVNGWKDKTLYMILELKEDGKLVLRAHTDMAEKEHEYFFDPAEMRYHLKADHSDEGIPVTIGNGVLTEETDDHLMVYELTDGPI